MASEKISRRKALKTLAVAASGLGAAAFLPAKWLKPFVRAGVIPAHAMTSTLKICTDMTIIPGFKDDWNPNTQKGLVNDIMVTISNPTPPAGTHVSYSILNVVPAGKLKGTLSDSGKTDANGVVYFKGEITYTSSPQYTVDFRVKTLGCYKDFHVDNSN